MAAKKAVSLSKPSFSELKDKVKDLEGLKTMNRFEITQAVRQAENMPVDPEVEKANPRQIKTEIAAAKAKLADTPKGEKKARKELRKTVARLKRTTRNYL